MVVVGVVAAAVLRRRAQDDEHSVEHYHRQLHTLEELRTHPASGAEGREDNGHERRRVPGQRLPGVGLVDRAPDRDPATPSSRPSHRRRCRTPPSRCSSTTRTSRHVGGADLHDGVDDQAMHSINHRPRRLGGPLAAVAAVAVLIVVLIVTGLHSNTPPKTSDVGHGDDRHDHGTGARPLARSTGAGGIDAQEEEHDDDHGARRPCPRRTSISAERRDVSSGGRQLLARAVGEDGGVLDLGDRLHDRHVLFTGVLTAGQSHTVAATGPGHRRRGRAGGLCRDGQRRGRRSCPSGSRHPSR